VSTHTSYKSLIKQILSLTTVSLSISLMSLGAAHAEQYCKSLDKDGNATYTLASDKGCKKMKTIAISHHTPSTTPKPEAAKTTATAAAATAQTNTTPASSAPANTGTSTTPAPTTAATTPSVNATPNPDTSKGTTTAK